MTALVLFAHGSRDPNWAGPFREVRRKVAESRPGVAIELAFLEIMEPALPETVERLAASGQTRITIAPLFMAQGAHLARDLAQMVSKLRDAHPQVEIVLLPPAGEAGPVLDAISAWVAQHA